MKKKEQAREKLRLGEQDLPNGAHLSLLGMQYIFGIEGAPRRSVKLFDLRGLYQPVGITGLFGKLYNFQVSCYL